MKFVKWFVSFAVLVAVIIIFNSCNEVKTAGSTGWKKELQDWLPEFGHRNWILIVDKAFPSQTADGIITIDTDDNLLNVLSYTLQQIDCSSHLSPIIYTDKELHFLNNDLVPDIDVFRDSLSCIIGHYHPTVLLHDSVFVKIDRASQLFKILVLKTNEVIPYSSVFIELDCKYWSEENENKLRNTMIKYQD